MIAYCLLFLLFTVPAHAAQNTTTCTLVPNQKISEIRLQNSLDLAQLLLNTEQNEQEINASIKHFIISLKSKFECTFYSAVIPAQPEIHTLKEIIQSYAPRSAKKLLLNKYGRKRERKERDNRNKRQRLYLVQKTNYDADTENNAV